MLTRYLPRKITATKNPIAILASFTMSNIISSEPADFASTIEVTIAKISKPRSSSITAAPRIIFPSEELIFFKSFNTLAVIPTLVAVRVAPTK